MNSILGLEAETCDFQTFEVDVTRFEISFRTPPPPLAQNQARDSASPAWPGRGLVPKMDFHSSEFCLQSGCVSEDNFGLEQL